MPCWRRRGIPRASPASTAWPREFDWNVTDPGSVQAALAVVGEIDVLVSNAGETTNGPVETTPVEEFRRLFELNTLGALRVTQPLVTQFRLRGSGRLIFVSSVLGQIALPLKSPYAASKWAGLGRRGGCGCGDRRRDRGRPAAVAGAGRRLCGGGHGAKVRGRARRPVACCPRPGLTRTAMSAGPGSRPIACPVPARRAWARRPAPGRAGASGAEGHRAEGLPSVRFGQPPRRGQLVRLGWASKYSRLRSTKASTVSASVPVTVRMTSLVPAKMPLR